MDLVIQEAPCNSLNLLGFGTKRGEHQAKTYEKISSQMEPLTHRLAFSTSTMFLSVIINQDPPAKFFKRDLSITVDTRGR